MSRALVRDALARRVNLIDSRQLLAWGLTRPSDVTGLDTIGIPTYTIPRPPGKAITISSGKGLHKFLSKAGAILEGIELFAAEHPDDSPHHIVPICHSQRYFTKVLAPNFFALVTDAPLYEHTAISYDVMDDLIDGDPIFVPSDLIWLEQRDITPFFYFQTSSNGLAAGYSRRDAELSGLYETIERDGWGIADYVQDQIGQSAPRVSLECDLPDSIRWICDKLENAGVIPFVFDLATDLNVPTFGCYLLDISDESPGAFAGYGCHLDSETALRRAMTEAAQSRCSYVSGARDDMLRRRFLVMKKVDQKKLLAMFNLIPCSRSFDSYELQSFPTLEAEWDELMKRIDSQITELYSKLLYRSAVAEDGTEIFIVRIVTPQLETPVWEHRVPGQRAIRNVQEFAL